MHVARRPRAAVVVFPGSNCDYDTEHVLSEVVGFEAERVWHENRDFSRYSLIVLPGGFSYGDYLRAGAIAALSPAVHALPDYIEREQGFVVGICNGFQILTEAHLLPGALLRNTSGKFICETVWLRVETAQTPFTEAFEPGELVDLPIAHAEGRYYAPELVLQELRDQDRILLTYHGRNPNGSLWNIAGITNERRNVFGLMPHPERNAEPLLGSGVGRRFFEGLYRAARAAASP